MDGLFATDTIVSSISTLLPTTGDLITLLLIILAGSRLLSLTKSFALVLVCLFGFVALHFDPGAPTELSDAVRSTLSLF